MSVCLAKSDSLVMKVRLIVTKVFLMSHETVPCPHCGGEIAVDAKFCRHCGSSDSDGWRDDEEGFADSYGEDFDYDEFVQDEFAGEDISHPLTNTKTKTGWRLVAVILLLLALLGFIAF